MIFSCYEIKNKRKCTELGRERMSNDLIELNDMDLNYIYFGDDTDSNDLVTILMKTFHCKKAYFKQLSTIRTSEVI